jgi:hypothetical protein
MPLARLDALLESGARLKTGMFALFDPGAAVR